jgi:hypothetical protein
MRQLEEENYQLKKLVADLSLDKQMLQDVLKKTLRPDADPRAADGLPMYLTRVNANYKSISQRMVIGVKKGDEASI